MSKLKVFLDFDETLFNHHAYMDWADTFLEKFGMQSGKYRKTIDSFHTPMGEKLRLYRHEEHITAASGKHWSFVSGEFERELIRGEHDFCYEDTHDFLTKITQLDFDLRVLTYGNGEYQRYKINICPFLKELRIPVHIVNQPKRLFLAEHFGGSAGILLDDKYPLNLPNPWQHFWIHRAEKLSKPKYISETHTIQLSNLHQFEQALKLSNSLS